MPNKPSAPRVSDTLSIKIGRWIEASATGWGLATLVVLAAVVAAAVVVVGPGLWAR